MFSSGQPCLRASYVVPEARLASLKAKHKAVGISLRFRGSGGAAAGQCDPAEHKGDAPISRWRGSRLGRESSLSSAVSRAVSPVFDNASSFIPNIHNEFQVLFLHSSRPLKE